MERYSYKWRNGVPNSKMDEFRDNIHRWMRSHYVGMKDSDAYIQMIDEYYRGYLESDSKLSVRKVNSQYADMCKLSRKIIPTMGIGQFEYSCIGQGWFDYMNWKINQMK